MERLKKNDFSTLPEVHACTAGLKSITTSATAVRSMISTSVFLTLVEKYPLLPAPFQHEWRAIHDLTSNSVYELFAGWY